MNEEHDIYPEDPENQDQSSELIRLTRDQIEAKMAKQILEALPDDPSELLTNVVRQQHITELYEARDQVWEMVDQLIEINRLQAEEILAEQTKRVSSSVDAANAIKVIRDTMREQNIAAQSRDADLVTALTVARHDLATANTTIGDMMERNGNMSNQIADWASGINSLCHYITGIWNTTNIDEAKMFANKWLDAVIPFLESDNIGNDVDDPEHEFDLERSYARQVGKIGEQRTRENFEEDGKEFPE